MSTTPNNGNIVIGIDLGTTNSALAWSEPSGPVRVFDVPQLLLTGDLASEPTLPSFLYAPFGAERPAPLPWNSPPDWLVGVYAREQGALVPARQVASAKSWLSNAAVDRTAAMLPWGVDDGPRLSPVEASSRILAHLRDAWNHGHADGPGATRLEQLPIVLTVPASFDEEARELTVEAARDAGFDNLTLLEEPLAALYAWIAGHRRTAGRALSEGGLLLVCDVGGGTTDFSLLRTSIEAGDLRFERIAIGEHLLLGGDNLDLALAVLMEQKLAAAGAPRLTIAQRQTLRRKCSAAKEQLLSSDTERVRITILGAGRGVIGGGAAAELSRDEVRTALFDGFLPIVTAEDIPARDRRVGLRELGLPYEPEAAITRHLAAFLTRAGRPSSTSMVRPDAVLFNGGFFTPPVARERVLQAIEGWFGRMPLMLENERPEAAVAIGAAFYGRLRQDPAAARRFLIRAGSARAYYVGVEEPGQHQGTSAVCIMPRGTDEGTTFELGRELTAVTNRPVAFTLYSSTDRSDPLDALVRFTDDERFHRHAPLVTSLRYGKRSRRVPLGVTLRTAFTETGTLELWCASRTTDHRWTLQFNLRGAEADPLEQDVEPEGRDEDRILVAGSAVDLSIDHLRALFGSGVGSPETLMADLETMLGHGKQSWPLDVIRRLADALLEVADGRRRSAAFEARWLNTAGFCMRPGFGTPLDAFRASELRKVYAAGLAFPREIQNQVEWLVLWQRVGAGFSAGQQRELAQRVSGQLGIGQRKPPRVNAQIEREGWRLLGSLERLDQSHRVKLGDEMLSRIRRDPRNPAWLWALARFGARRPLYGPLNGVVAPAVAERWIDALLGLKAITADTMNAIVQIAAQTGDAARDVSPETRGRAIAALRDRGASDEMLRPLLTAVPVEGFESSRVFGEALPDGLRLGGLTPV